MTTITKIKYGGFWVRLCASMIDLLLWIIIISPILWETYGNANFYTTAFMMGATGYLLTSILLFLTVILFWRFKSATPGKMLFKLIIVDSETLQKPSTKQLVLRYFGCFISIIPFCLGFIWVAFDRRKQGWHDKLAGTVVIRKNA